MRYLVAALFLTIPVLSIPALASAATYIVRPDGTGDFPTIQAAVQAATTGDTILLADGAFVGNGNRDVSYLGKGITIRSQCGNPEACRIDARGGPGFDHRAFLFVSDEDSTAVLEGVTIVNGYVDPPACGGGVEASGSDPTFNRCIFIHCSAYEGGGANFTSACHPTFTDCQFYDNTAIAGGGLAIASASNARITRCTFAFNTATARGGGVSFAWSMGTIRNCTFYANAGPEGGGIADGAGAIIEIENSAVTASPTGAAVYCGSSFLPTLSCCDLYANAGGDWVACIADQLGIRGNIGLDPLLCDPEGRNFRLQVESPCAPFSPPNPECDLIGAWPVGCEPADVPTVEIAGLALRSASPCSGRVHLAYSIPPNASGPVTLSIHDVTGRKVRQLAVDPHVRGDHQVAWDGTRRGGSPAPGGVYFCRLRVGRESVILRVLLVR